MGYAAARGGLAAIVAAEDLVRRSRIVADSPWLGRDQLIDRMRLAVDRVMGEGGMWCPELAATALRQAEGDLIEAAHLLRSYRATLPRFAYSETVPTDEMTVLRRIVPAFRNPPGPQLLGRTSDYTGRLLDLTDEDDARNQAEKLIASEAMAEQAAVDEPLGDGTQRSPGRLIDVLRDMDMVVDRRRTDDPEPIDITRVPARPPAPRSARLALMARAETGALVNLWYRNILGPDGYLHEITLGDVRHGYLPVPVVHPRTGETITIGEIRVTDAEAIEDLDGLDEDRRRFDVGYGACLGHNERKAIAMANLDIACHRDAGRTQLEQSILLTTDGLDASGFLEHLKLPHYVTFRSMMERKLAMRAVADAEHDGPLVAGQVDRPVGRPVPDRSGTVARESAAAARRRPERVAEGTAADDESTDRTPAPRLLDDYALRELRRAILTAVAVPGYQVPFGSREMPVARGWGSGGLQVTLALVGADDVVKVIDQGDDEGVNAVNLRRLITSSTGAGETTDPAEATVVQSRHRIPEDELGEDQILVLQVPVPEPLRGVERDMRRLARMHAEADYSRMWVSLYEDKVRNGVITQTTGYPCLVGGRYVVATTPIPRWDIPRLNRAPFLTLFGAGREKRIYAIPPDTDVEPLTFHDVPFEVEHTPGAVCRRCGSAESFLVEVPAGVSGILGDGSSTWVCSDTDWCRRKESTTARQGHTP